MIIRRNDLLDVCIFKRKNRLDFLHYTFKILARRHTNYSDINFFRAKKIRITASSKPVLVHTDCEIIPMTVVSIEFTVLPRTLKVITH